MARKPNNKVETLVSAGGVVYRQVDGQIDTVLCGRSNPVRWSLAKGTPDEGETLEETALSEVREGTGLEVTRDTTRGIMEYGLSDRDGEDSSHKSGPFYLMQAVGGDTEHHDPEFDVVRWFPFDEAIRIAAYPNEINVLRRALELISVGKEEG